MNRPGIRGQALLLSMAFLVVPLAGYLHVRSFENLLLVGQQESQASSARHLATVIAAARLLPQIETSAPGRDLYAYRLEQLMEIDGRDDDWAPHFACIAAGEALRQVMTAHPDRDLTVLSGHTHGGGEVDMLPNLHCVTGGARYGAPEVQRIIEVPGGSTG